MLVKFEVEKRLGDFLLSAAGELAEGLRCIVGPNGSGKTTLMKILAGLLKPDRGYVTRHGVKFAVYVADLPAPPDALGLDVLAAGLTRFSKTPITRDEEKDLLNYAELLEAAHLARRRWGTLSGGERQRLIIAAALASEADLLILDEPLAHLHGDWRSRVMEILRDYAKGRIVAISVHHADVLGCCDEVLAMRDGKLAWRGSPSEFTWPMEGRCKV
ncbi:ABC-type cobalamin/Fe3+-siderophores transport systems, ATPase component [Pyrobaculum oguniense TE7]|uniref:ABC-type cobalamin/Fe3+-siderophores transport systems, ATPase component n=1 Tax=Pyrobaculum oguniense (strain DSM 13380 / JCM 10595 / TE7) TaxID=698757 RepID=H6QBY4_PYROT|nr:ABC-type cobalamin/Fe3+-siderophores transport systems, ATPase component [Pyrobaculum oguniense TE7]